MLKATNTNTCKHAMERVALRRGLISAQTGEERTAAAAREIQLCQLGHLHTIRCENRLLEGIFGAEKKVSKGWTKKRFFMGMEVFLSRGWLTFSKGDSYKVLLEHSQTLEPRK
jgi:hypothetical protein